ncbi:hypothetical protein [Frigoribacterium sp. Leaf263]|uniref:hypothetical protein n=1 Tax=Frigoribacterium sp. Leaf263 TaxID=1736313 RepID=UPI000ABF7F1A|nr:hypothetical protein [Frigoribacterium sp. Leaf263]
MSSSRTGLARAPRPLGSRLLRLTAVVAAVAVAAGGLVVGAQPAPAVAAPSAASATSASGADFDPGFIISDANFYASNAMTGTQIQSFLNSKGGSCTGSNCLKVKKVASNTRAADKYCGRYAGASSESTATIIQKVSAACGVSAMVMLVILEKEQSLVTYSGNPSNERLGRAMGYACPDTTNGACDASYYGLFNQLYSSAHQMKVYGTSSFFNWYPVGKVSNVLYNPNSACGSSPVRIQNKATAALYYYTPYQPNAAALRNMYGTGDSCSAYGNRNFFRLYTDWFGSTTGDVKPFGKLEAVSFVKAGTARVKGWAIDPDTADPIAVHVYVDGRYSKAATASVSRADVGRAHPRYGAAHGFSIDIPKTTAKSHQFCVYGINVGFGSNTQLGCRTFTMSSDPQGRLDAVTSPAAGKATVTGWALDPNASRSIGVQIYADGRKVATVTADRSRPDIGRAYPDWGPARGYSATVSLPPGKHSFCAYGMNIGGGQSARLGPCKTATVASASSASEASPKGRFELLEHRSAGLLYAKGWALDPSTSAATKVRVSVDGKTVATVNATANRPDVGRAYPSAGPYRGWTAVLSGMNPGTYAICATAVNVGDGKDVALPSCRTATVSTTWPQGRVDNVTSTTAGRVDISGWALDADLKTKPITVDIRIDGVSRGVVTASTARPDIARAFPASGANHGFTANVRGVRAGSHEVCAVARSAGGVGGDTPLNCRTVTVR